MKKENVFEGDLTTKEGKVYPYTQITGSLYISADAKRPVRVQGEVKI